jgi:hypothetical protein
MVTIKEIISPIQYQSDCHNQGFFFGKLQAGFGMPMRCYGPQISFLTIIVIHSHPIPITHHFTP